jgi:hypothetical protein
VAILVPSDNVVEYNASQPMEFPPCELSCW